MLISPFISVKRGNPTASHGRGGKLMVTCVRWTRRKTFCAIVQNDLPHVRAQVIKTSAAQGQKSPLRRSDAPELTPGIHLSALGVARSAGLTAEVGAFAAACFC
ncbi:hypothetical protein HPP92_018744 [Vanilla planifolia]|uniref:Uncharacterized protein n=1 Tax=Vanilla planifolia TaxID=51239 RepID=A0A835Q7K1_VANPL|nr:hypothetical protein HPP92_018744 [Vanilla planifolia]